MRDGRRALARRAGAVCLLAFGLIGLPSLARGQTCLVTTPIGAGSDRGTAVAVQPDGRILLGGYYFSGASDDFALVRYNPDFTLDASFGTGGIVTTAISAGEDRAEAIALQPDGKILLAGHKNSGAGNNDFAVVRYNQNGSLDTTFNPGGLFGGAPNLAGMVTTAVTGANDELEAVVVQADGKIVVAGFANFSVAGTMNYAVARYNANGSLDTSGFNAPTGYVVSTVPTDDTANAIAIQPSDGKIVLAGWANSGVNDDFALVRYNTNGTQDLGFGNVLINFPSNSRDRAHALAIQPSDGKIVLGGEVRSGGWAMFGAARRNPDGSADATFGVGGVVTTDFTGVHDEPFGLVLQSDLKVVLGGYSNWSGAGTSVDMALARFTTAGALDTSFDLDGKVTTDVAANNDWFDSLAIQPDGKVVGGGYSVIANNDFLLARYNSNGSLDTSCVKTNYRSIGVNAGVVYATGTASVTAGTNRVTFGGGASLPLPTAVGAVGTGDLLTVNPGAGQEIFYIQSRDSTTQVTVQAGAMSTQSGVPYEIRRAYTTLQAWEDARNGDLVAGNRREVGVAYKDGPFVPPFASANAALVINGSVTDASRFMSLTVASGQRHNGTAGTGVVVDGQTATKFGILDQDNFTHIEWLELVRFKTPGNAGFASIVTEGVGALYQTLLIHDFLEPTVSGDGVRVSATVGGWSFTLRNSVIYDGDRTGIRVDEPTSSATVDNCTVYDMESWGVAVGSGGGTITATNTISMGNVTGSFTAGSGTLNQTNNISSDGTGTLTFRTATDVATATPSSVVFMSLGAGTEDLHLRPSTVNDARDNASNLSSSFCCDIDGGIRVAPWDVGADDLAAATAVKLASFEATPGDEEVALAWTTSSELDNLGFDLYRAQAADGPYERITSVAIPGLGSSPTGARYEYRDRGLENGVTYFYQLEDIDTHGATERHGPVAATPSALGGELASEDPAFENEARITYGDPSRSSLRVSQSGPYELVVQLRTEGFVAGAREDGTVRLSVPDFFEIEEPGAPSVPIRRTWLDVLSGRSVEVLSIRERDVEVFHGLRPSDSDLLEIVASPAGTVRARVRGSARRLARNEGTLYPAEAARVSSVGYQGETKKALLELAPLRWDASSGKLHLARDLEVRLSLRRRDADASGERGRRSRHKESRTLVTRLATRTRGLYAVRYEDLFGRRKSSRTMPLRLSRQGETVPFHLEPEGRSFEPGSTLFFLGEGEEANPYGREAVYELEAGVEGERMAQDSHSPSGSPVASYWSTLDEEENRLYQAGLLDAPDAWLWDVLFAPQTKSYPVIATGLAASLASARVTVWLQGASDLPINTDHHVRLYVNGIFVSEASWDGKGARTIEADLSPGILREGENRIEIENVGDTGAAYSMVMLDRIRLRYQRSPLPEDGRIDGEWSDEGVAEVLGMGPCAHVLDVTGKWPLWQTRTELGVDGTLRFGVQAGRRYLAVRADALLHPEVRTVPSGGASRDRASADYLVVGPAAFLREAKPLLDLRASQGLRVRAIAIEDIASEFGFGETTPAALQEFLDYAYHEWRRPAIRYVLLLGDATYDFKNYLQTGVENRVPPAIVKTSYLWTASDPAYASVNGDDLLPDFAIGRLPAATAEEARSMVEKIVAWETGGGTLAGPVVLVADNPDRAGDFERDAEALASGVLASRRSELVFLGRLGAATTRETIASKFDEGLSLMSYIGHGGIHLWADEDIWDLSNVRALSPQPRQPLLLTMNCLNGYFHFPYFNSLSEELLKAEGRGVIAAFSPSGLSVNAPAQIYHEALLKELVDGRHSRLGDAILAAQRTYTETGAFPELLQIYNLLGDPALVLR